MANIHSQKKRILRSSVSASRTAATRRRSRRTSAASRPRSPAATTGAADAEHRDLVSDDRQGRQARRAAPQHRRAQEVPRRAPARVARLSTYARSATSSVRHRQGAGSAASRAPRCTWARSRGWPDRRRDAARRERPITLGTARSAHAAAAVTRPQRSASVSAASSLRPARGQLEVGERLERAAQGAGVGRPRLLDPPVGGVGGMPQRPGLDLRRASSPASSALGDGEHVAHAARHQRDEARRATRPGRAARGRRASPLAVARDERVDEPPDLALGGAAPRASTSSTPIVGARAVLERELLELAQQPLLAVADAARRAPARAGRRARRRARAAWPIAQRGSSRAFSTLLGGDVAAGRARPRRAARLGRLERDRPRGRRTRRSCPAAACMASAATSAPRRRRPSSARRRRRSRSAGRSRTSSRSAPARRPSGVRASPSRSSTPPLPGLAPRRAPAAARAARRCARGRRRG